MKKILKYSYKRTGSGYYILQKYFFKDIIICIEVLPYPHFKYCSHFCYLKFLKKNPYLRVKDIIDVLNKI